MSKENSKNIPTKDLHTILYEVMNDPNLWNNNQTKNGETHQG